MINKITENLYNIIDNKLQEIKITYNNNLTCLNKITLLLKDINNKLNMNSYLINNINTTNNIDNKIIHENYNELNKHIGSFNTKLDNS